MSTDAEKMGYMQAQVDALEKQVSELRDDVRQLLELANKSKGGFWAGMAIASAIGGFVGWLSQNLHITTR